MNLLYFIVEWQKNKHRTWSGTCWGLYSSLKKYFIIYDIDVHESFVSKVLRKILKVNTLFGLRNIIHKRKKLGSIFNSKRCKVFQFAEYVNNPNIDSYLYIDVDVNYIKYLYENEYEIFKYSNFSNQSKSSIDIRNQSQVEYLSTCSGIFTMGRWLKNSMIERLNLSQDVIHHVGGGINLSPSRIKDIGKAHNKILFVGRDFERKGGFLLINAFNILRSRIEDVQLHIVGPSQQPFSEHIPGVFFYGDVNHRKIEDLMNICDIFVMPSYFEAYGLVFIEALAFGLPCIGRNAYEMPYFIENEETGLLIEDDDPIDLANKMELLLKDHSYSERVKAKREWYIKEYSWDTVAERIYNILQN